MHYIITVCNNIPSAMLRLFYRVHIPTTKCATKCAKVPTKFQQKNCKNLSSGSRTKHTRPKAWPPTPLNPLTLETLLLPGKQPALERHGLYPWPPTPLDCSPSRPFSPKDNLKAQIVDCAQAINNPAFPHPAFDCAQAINNPAFPHPAFPGDRFVME